jgi:DUF4097 and DUF4098 domain-containing protein YvlB
MKSIRSHTIFALVSIATVAGAHAVLAAKEVREEFRQTYPLDKQGKVRLDNINGNVRIVTWDREEINVEAIKRAKTQEHLDQVKIEVDAKADQFRIRTKYPDSKSRRNKDNSVSVEYVLTVPQQSRLDRINTVNGNVEIEKVGGDVEASSVNGSVTAAGLAGQAELSTVNGSVKANFSALKKSVSLKSVNGSVTVSLPPEANAKVSAHTVTGGISSDFGLQTKSTFPSGKIWTANSARVARR